MRVLDQLFFRPRGGVLESRLHEGRKRMHLGVLVGRLEHRFDLGVHLGAFKLCQAGCGDLSEIGIVRLEGSNQI